ncbi:selenium cofactor biosynthesis protein YqeC [Halalkalicoccus jeotgali]|uniref:Anaerobic dehydrogenase cluster protein n=1 Tax=Halalkalicoccus jeotgali (strain DSM 18796 / CECT 7217 / JCM 14584 / KCTC 4019 / B3) TaxID=795797 RepID=D8J2W2_HALJB|nr:selenium cofactor biosynthesis protein YqeC [Halalkalicoccus jeotgali]ADJ15069.1 anaerobic dehydrogenase cluster protein [Halalkalicoccus jeotgali B3]ELY34912.1 anaerobic dehydrogenase cluster protein [Halalkalicoccus jeotgali B3]
MKLTEALPTEGLTCVVGAGGKKTTLYALANALERAVVTATVRIPIFDPHVARVVVTDDPVSAIEENDEWPLGVVPEREFEDRYRGYDRTVVEELARETDTPVLVKADGARMREFKAPNGDEPQLPANADAVLPVASVHAVGEPLSDAVVHRPERVGAIAGIEAGEEITPAAVARVLASPEGGLKGVTEGAAAIPILNKVDDSEDETVAREIAHEIHERAAVERVVLARMAEPEIVDVIRGA